MRRPVASRLKMSDRTVSRRMVAQSVGLFGDNWKFMPNLCKVSLMYPVQYCDSFRSDPQTIWRICGRALPPFNVFDSSKVYPDVPVGPSDGDLKTMATFSLRDNSDLTRVTRKIYADQWDAATTSPTWARDPKTIGRLCTFMAYHPANSLARGREILHQPHGVFDFLLYRRIFAQQFHDAFELPLPTLLTYHPRVSSTVSQRWPAPSCGLHGGAIPTLRPERGA